MKLQLIIFHILLVYNLIAQCDLAITSYTNSSWCECSGYATAQPLSGTAPYNFIWSNGDTINSIDSLCGGVYYVTMTDDAGCSAIEFVFIDEPDSLTYEINTTPAQDTCCNGSIEIQITGGGCPPFVYNFLTTIDPLNLCSGSYSFQIIDYCGCIIEDTAIVGSQSCQIKNKKSSNIKIFPNPIEDYFIVQIPDNINNEVLVSILNINGINIFKKKLLNEKQFKIDNLEINSGVYLLRVIANNKLITKRIIVR